MRLVVMIPAYNEEKTIGSVIEEIPRKIQGIDSVQVLVINDGSTDETVEVARLAGADEILSHKTNLGLGVAFRDGMEQALKMGADIIVNIDADAQFGSKDILPLIEPILKKEVDFVIASRFLNKSWEPKLPWIKKIGNKFFTNLISHLAGQKFTDTQCGFRAYSKEAALRLNTFGEFTYTQEVILDLANKGISTKEIPIKIRERKGKSKVVKHCYSYGLSALTIIIRYVRDYRPLSFFGTIGIGTLLPGLVVGIWMLLRWSITGRTSPYTSLLYLVVVLIVLGVLFIVLALIADMIGRQRRIQEDLIYYQKSLRYANVDRDRELQEERLYKLKKIEIEKEKRKS